MPDGLLSSIYNYLIIYFIIFAISSISGMFSERVGIVNIGINGMMVIGAATYLVFTQQLYTWFGSKSIGTSPWWQIVGMLFAMICAALFSLLHGFATIKLKSDHTISGFSINLLAFGIALILLNIYGNNSKAPKMLVEELRWSVKDSKGFIWEIFSLKTFIVIAVIVVSSIMLYKTKWGLRFRSIGENPQAADVAGINVNSYKWQGVIISGALAGIAGSFFAHSFPAAFRGDVNGFGYLALAIMIMGQWNVGIIVSISFVFALLYSFAYTTPNFYLNLKPLRDLFLVIPYFLTLIIVIATAKKSHAPAASGIAYDKSKR